MVNKNCSLTVFLGGAGMVGDYNDDMVAALKDIGIQNPIYGNYSAFIKGFDRHLPGTLDMLGDAAAVIFYNQDKNDPSILRIGDPLHCTPTLEQYIKNSKIKKDIKVGGFSIIRIRKLTRPINKSARCKKPNTNSKLWLSVKKKINKKTVHATFALVDLEINKSLPKCGQFNIIGYSWGAIIAARSAVYHADMGITVDHLVLIGAPINKSLLKAVKNNVNIKKVIIVNLNNHGDPLFAGISDEQIIKSALKLTKQMMNGEGHFYYTSAAGKGKTRRRELVKRLYQEGLR